MKWTEEDLEEAVARMKIAQATDVPEMRGEGFAVGTRWALEVARPRQLRNLQKAQPTLAYDKKHLGYCLWMTITSNGWDGLSPADFWREAMGGMEGGEARIDEDAQFAREFAREFVAGALAVWKCVENRLDG